jgi:hypothetical protein
MVLNLAWEDQRDNENMSVYTHMYNKQFVH